MEELFPKNLLNTEAKDEINKIKRIEQEIIRDNLIYKKGNKRNNKYRFSKV